MSHLRTITGFAGKKDDNTGMRPEFQVPKVMESKEGSTYIALVFGATVSPDGELLDKTIRFFFADKELLDTVVVGNSKLVEPIEQD